LRAFGANSNRIFLLIWLGMVLLVSVGMLTGIALGFFIARFVCDKISAEGGFKFAVWFEWQDFGSLFLFLAFLSIALLIPCAFTYRYTAANFLRESF
jgi:ABC-type antimicrobial peptide transport system permease subunit